MKTVDTATTDAWKAAFKGGDARPMVRATIQRLDVKFTRYNLKDAPGQHRKGTGKFAHALFGQKTRPVELPNIKSMSYTRTIDQDVATMQMELWNTRVLKLGDIPNDDYEWEIPGYYTAGRGEDPANRWGYSQNPWHNRIVPDRLIRTYEGYGYDGSQPPEKDPHMYPSGVWLIDDVAYTTEGTIQLNCRDVGRMLMDQICFPPVVPYHEYPLVWSKFQNVPNPDIVTEQSAWIRPTYDTDSNVPYIGKGFTDGGRAYVGANGGVYGHFGKHAFDGDDNTYWLSVGNMPNWSSAFEYVQGQFGSRDVYGVRLKVWGGPYRVYVSVFADGEWKGGKTIPYAAREVDTHADIDFVKAFTIGKNDEMQVRLPKVINNATHIRITLTDLYNSGLGYYRFRGGIKNVMVSSQVTKTTDGGTHIEGNYNDYSDIVRWLTAWGGFYWPTDASGNDFLTLSDGTTETVAPPGDDPNLVQPDPGGRVWGNIKNTGTAGIVDLGIDIWDKKPLMDGLKYVKDITGFNLWIDEAGSVIWRLPNQWKKGNVLWEGGGPAPNTTTDYVTIDERETLTQMTATLSSQNIRERVFVSNVNGRFGAVVEGYNPYPAKLRRVAGWCVDTRTEIFTDRGWLHWDEVKEGDLTLALREDGKSVWEPIHKVAIFEAQPRTMLQFRSRTFSALTTPDHRWLVERFNTHRGEYDTMWATSETLTAMDRVARAAPGADRPVTPVHSNDLVELVAWAYTEGCIKRGKGCDVVVLYQSHEANPEHVARIDALLGRVFERGVRRRERRGTTEWTLSTDASTTVLPHLGDDKAPVMEFLMALTQEQLELFVEVSIMADGYHRRDGSRFFYQNVGPRLDSFLTACALAGLATSYKVVEPGTYENTFSKQPKAQVSVYRSGRHVTFANGRAKPMEVEYDDVVWCPSLAQHHTWLARRDGSIYFTGNTDQNFQTQAECRVMAKLIALQQYFTYRQNTLTIPGNPAIQIDDQIKIIERMTNETNFHYVKGITSNWDAASGKWTYTLQTHWLGDDPSGTWWYNASLLDEDTHRYLSTLGAI